MNELLSNFTCQLGKHLERYRLRKIPDEGLGQVAKEAEDGTGDGTLVALSNGVRKKPAMNEAKQIQGTLGIEGLLVGFEPGDTVFGRFTLERHLGGTAVGVVWSAYDCDFERRVALKLYPAVVFCDEAGLRHLRRVMDAVRRVRISGVAALLDLVEDEEWIGVVCELVDGTSLATELQMIRPEGMDLGEMKGIVKQVAMTMHAVHEEYSLVHGKLSPGNIMRTPDGRVKIMDLGLARVLSDCVQRATRIEGAMGELPYLSPQQLDGEVPRPSDDIYAFGSTVYECITGKPPFFSGDIVWEIRNGVVPTLAERRREFGLDNLPIPKFWEKLVASCLSKHTEERPSSFKELIASKEFAALPGKNSESLEELHVQKHRKKHPAVDYAEETPKIAVEARQKAQAAQQATAASMATSLASRMAAPMQGQVTADQAGVPVPMNGHGHTNGHGGGFKKDKSFKMLDETVEAEAATVESSASVPPAAPRPKPAQTQFEPAKSRTAQAVSTPSEALPTRDTGSQRNGQLRIAAMISILLVLGGLAATVMRFGGVERLTQFIRPLALSGENNDSGNLPVVTAGTPGKPSSQEVEKAMAALQATRNESPASHTNSADAKNSAISDSEHDDPAVAEVASGNVLPANTSTNAISKPTTANIIAEANTSLAKAQAASKQSDSPTALQADVAASESTEDTSDTLSSKIEQMFGEELENLSPEEKAAIEALRKAEAARIEAQRQLEAARLRREAEARLAEMERAVEQSRNLAKMKESAVSQAIAALEAIKAERQSVLGNVREMMSESQQLQSQITEIERSTAAVQQRIAELEAKLESERAAYAEATSKMQEVKDKANARMSEITKIREMAAKFDERISEAGSKVESTRLELDAANKALAELEAKLEAMRKQFQEGNYNAVAPQGHPSAPAAPTSPESAKAQVDSEMSTSRSQAMRSPADAAPPPSGSFENSLGMRFVPIGDVLFSVWETRRKDFEKFVEETGHKPPANWADPGFKQEPDHPVVNVTWEDAMAFCQWLTERDRSKGIISASQQYRLPTDMEWSIAAGLTGERGETPEVRDMDITGVFPWGTEWPPPAGAGNYTGEESGSEVAIRAYSDGYKWTSPVGSFPPNAYGLYDMGGNVWEWCMDWWNADQKQKVLRGASWYNGGLKLSLLTSCRICSSPTSTTDNYGFRLVLASAG